MMYGNKKLLLPAILGVFLALFIAVKTFAQTPSNFDLTVSPVFFDFSSNPGDKINDRIRVRNNTQSDITVAIDVKKLGGDETGTLTLQNVKEESLSWVEFQNQTVTATAGEWTDVPFSINIPNDASFGYYFAITFTQNNNGESEETGTSLTGVSAVPILLNVKREGAKAEGKILEFKANSYINEYLPIDFVTKVQNTGNVHIRPRGNIFIRGGRDKDLAILDVNEALGNIIPGTNRTFQSKWADGFLVKEPVIEYNEPKKDKNGNIITKTVINWDKLTSFRIGKYTASMVLIFDDGKKDVTLEATADFWVFPYKAVAVILGGLIVIIVLLRFALKSYIKHEFKKRKV